MEKIKNIVLIGNKKVPMLLDIFFETQTSPQPLIIYVHGFNGFKDWGNGDLVAEKFAAAGFAFVKFNFSHNGTTLKQPAEFVNVEAFGHNNYSIELEDLKIIIDWVCHEDNPYKAVIDRQKIYLIGHSLGGGISIIFSSEDKRIKKLVTWASVSECKTPWGNWPSERIAAWRETGIEYYLNSRTKQQLPLYYQLYEDYQANQQRLDIKKAISILKIPLMICHGMQDTSVPVEKAYELTKAQPGAKLFTVVSDHVFGRKHPWIESKLPASMDKVVEASIEFLSEE